MHPEIPVEMSERAKHFILRCFEPDPDRRATAAELMEENFLSEFVLFIITHSVKSTDCSLKCVVIF